MAVKVAKQCHTQLPAASFPRLGCSDLLMPAVKRIERKKEVHRVQFYIVVIQDDDKSG